MSESRLALLRALAEASDHPDAEALRERASQAGKRISLPTVYRAAAALEAVGLLVRHEFDGKRGRYELAFESRHDHLIDVDTGRVVEFSDERIERLQEEAARRMGYRLTGRRMELYGKREGKGGAR